LINNAGILDGENSENDISKSICEQSLLSSTNNFNLDKLINVFDTNLKAVFQGTLLAKQHFQKQLETDSSKQFCIISTSSLSAIKPCLSFPVYSFTKNAVIYIYFISS
jgi:NAD(P)-dependent dehydrogenase (short-subunit alcohol dehydrogenase family)